MKTLLFAALIILALSLTAGVMIVVRDVHRDLIGVDLLLGRTSGTIVRLNQTVSSVNDAVGTLNGAAGEERKNWAATSKQAAATGRALRMLISRVDRSFVDGTLLHFNAVTLPAIDAQIDTNGKQLAATIAKLGESADGITAVTRQLNARFDDPAIPAILGHFNASSANLETITANSVAMSGDMKLAVHRLAQPPTKLHEVLNVSWTAAKFGSLFIP